MIAFDIETTGIDPANSVVTVVCTQDYHTGERRAYEFGRVRAGEPQNEVRLRGELIAAFDAADSLCAFNGVRFDIPFLHAALKLSPETTSSWLLKTTDILEAVRLGLFGPAHTFGLNLLCQHNQVAVKSGSGLQAIQFAQEGKWDALLSYCTDDVRILCDLYRRRLLNNPRFHGVIDLRTIAHASTYAEQPKRQRVEPRTQAHTQLRTQLRTQLHTQQADRAAQTEPCAEVADLRQRLLFYQEHVFPSPGAEDAVARLLAENARQQAELLELRRKLAVYNEFCVCFDECC
jgi:hypothetical protein